MKVSKVLVPILALTATQNYVYKNNQVVANCEQTCHDMFHHCIDMCTAHANWHILAPIGCYSGCGIAWTACMGICAAAR